MQPGQETQPAGNARAAMSNTAAAESPPPSRTATTLVPQGGGGTGECSCKAGADPERTGVASPAYVFALGQIEPRFPSLAVEKEFAQVTGRSETARLTDRQAFHAVASDRQNRYLARQM